MTLVAMDSDASGKTAAALDVVVVVVTWNSAAVVEGFIASLPRAMSDLRYRLVVADNASTDSTLDVVRAASPHCTIVEVGRNAGYAAGINAGLRGAPDAKATLICNPDVRLRPNSVRLLVSTLRDPRVGIAVPRLVDPNGVLCPSLRRRPTVLRALGEAVLGGSTAGRFGPLGEVVLLAEAYEHETDVDWATGAVMLVSGACLTTVGKWDESLFLYSEETDFALRAHDAGYSVRFVPDAVAEHDGGDLHRSPDLWRLQALNRVRLYGRRHGPVATRAFWAATTLNEALRAIAGRDNSRAAYRALRDWRPASDAS